MLLDGYYWIDGSICSSGLENTLVYTVKVYVVYGLCLYGVTYLCTSKNKIGMKGQIFFSTSKNIYSKYCDMIADDVFVINNID